MRNFWKWVLIAAVLTVVWFALFPPYTLSPMVAQRVRNLSNAKQLGLAAKLYAVDHEGRFPMHLSELTAEYIQMESWENLQFDPRKDIHDHVRPKQDWLYFGAFFDEKNPPPILIASPQTLTGTKILKRIVIRSDNSAQTVNENDYQHELRKTIEAMHKRVGTPATPATEALPASPDAATAPAVQETPDATDEKPNLR